MLALLARLRYSFTHSLQSSWESGFCLQNERVDFISFEPTVPPSHSVGRSIGLHLNRGRFHFWYGLLFLPARGLVVHTVKTAIPAFLLFYFLTDKLKSFHPPNTDNLFCLREFRPLHFAHTWLKRKMNFPTQRNN